MSETLPPFLTEKEVAVRWRLSVRWVANQRRSGRLAAQAYGRRVVYPRAAVLLFEDEHLVPAKTVMFGRGRSRL